MSEFIWGHTKIIIFFMIIILFRSCTIVSSVLSCSQNVQEVLGQTAYGHLLWYSCSSLYTLMNFSLLLLLILDLECIHINRLIYSQLLPMSVSSVQFKASWQIFCFGQKIVFFHNNYKMFGKIFLLLLTISRYFIRLIFCTKSKIFCFKLLEPF